MSISTQQLTRLGLYISDALTITPCDQTLHNATKWAEKNKIDEKELVQVLQQRGGYCDCEVLFNVLGWEDIPV